MAHEISTIGRENGEAIYRHNSAWHGLGITTPITDKRKLVSTIITEEYKLLNYNVSKRPLFFQNSRGEYVKLPDHSVTVRDDFDFPFAPVGNDYGLVQIKEAFAFLDSFIADGLVEYESAMALKGGRLVFLTVRLPGVVDVVPGDSIYKYIAFATSFDGSLKLQAFPTAIRIVCVNTARAAMRANTSIFQGVKHSGDMTEKLRILKDALSQFDEAFDNYAGKARLLAGKNVPSSKAAWDYLAELFPKKEETGKRADTIRENKVAAIQRNYHNPLNTLPGMAGSWWALYNSVTEMIDHGDEVTYKGKNDRDRAENKFISTVTGTGADFKARAFDRALAMASA